MMRPNRSGLPLVAVSAALWGSDALFRRGLAMELPAATVVLYEHLILTVIVLPLLFTIPWRRLTRTDRLCLLVIGAGASALATVLFTSAFRYGDRTALCCCRRCNPSLPWWQPAGFWESGRNRDFAVFFVPRWGPPGS